MSQFEFLVMTEKNIFAHKLFLSLNTSDFNLFLCENCNTPEKSHPSPLFPRNPPLKVEVLSSPPFWKIWLEAQSPCRKGGGVHYGLVYQLWECLYTRKWHQMIPLFHHSSMGTFLMQLESDCITGSHCMKQ